MGAYLPVLDEINTAREMIAEFGGYNHNPRINGNEFSDMGNMSGDMYPLLSQRRKRAKVRQFEKPNGLFAHEKLCWVDGARFYYDGVLKGDVADSPKQFVGMGAYVLIWPDKVYYNSTTDEFGSLGAKVTTSGTVTISLCRLDGADYVDYAVSDTPPENPENGDLWIDTSNTPQILKQYSATYGMWTSVPTTYVKIAADGISAELKEYDGVTISGLDNEKLNGEFILYGVGEGHIIITAIIDAAATQEEAVTIERRIPDMDYVTESENRVWGCSTANHEIYACKLGDPKNWYCFLGISTDSYVMTVGSSGDFTGCCTHLGYVLFFKADVIHKIYGNKPSNFQLTNTTCRGVEKGSEKSLVIVNETLYYKARQDICAYNASLPASVSDALGKVKYRDAVSGACGRKYYISMKSEDGPVMFAYDETRGLWHKEDEVYATYFAALGPELYFISDNDKCLYAVNGTLEEYGDENAALEKNFPWYAQTGDIGLEIPGNKYISKLQIRLEVEDKGILRIELQYDNDGIWVEKYRINITKKRAFTVPIIAKRCDTMRIRFSGAGVCRVYSLTKTIEEGSEL
jgi:hypothetical protein